ncbi:unnamed protein product [marine sediment metagenome]|uniref:Uncharacterized protein n=1 Tax=marine sediment metagenome TaxID=412755 RepID=X1UEU0_9ZZZZ
MYELMTMEELRASEVEYLDEEDKAFIEKALGSMEGEEETVKKRAMRGFLVSLLSEAEYSHSELDDAAATWADGWEYCLKYGGNM